MMMTVSRNIRLVVLALLASQNYAYIPTSLHIHNVGRPLPTFQSTSPIKGPCNYNHRKLVTHSKARVSSTGLGFNLASLSDVAKLSAPAGSLFVLAFIILVHETGHALVMHRLGIPFSPMVFIPFIGASVAMQRNPQDAYEEALVALGGPALGSLGALAVAGVAHMNQSQLLFALADFGFMINLFNLMPLGMMDGGRICGAISPYSGLVGLGMGGTLIWFGHISNPIFYLIFFAGGYQTVMRLWKPDESLPRNYYLLSNKQKGAIAGAYFGLVGGLIGAMAINERYKKSPEQLMYERERQYRSIRTADYEYRFRD